MLEAMSDARILVVDDQPANTVLIQRLLARKGATEITTTNDSREVARLLVDVDPDLVLLDLRMPHLDGFEVLRQVQQYAAGTYLPVIVITADDSKQSVQKALSMGAHDYVRKPFEASELVLRVRNLLITRLAIRELRRTRADLRARLHVFEPGLPGNLDETTLRSHLRRVIDDDLLQIALQPIVNMVDGSIYGYEALSRFPKDDIESPAAWFLAADRVGMTLDLERHALLKALRLLPTLPPSTRLAVNLSPPMLLADEFPEVPPDRVIVELTEHVPVEDYPLLERALLPLREQGVFLAIDDTGAGFASLQHILHLRPDVIKLDIGIVRGVDTDHRRSAIAGMMLQFASTTHALVVAEGVETPTERDTLVGLGAVFGQGYLFGRPQIVTGAADTVLRRPDSTLWERA